MTQRFDLTTQEGKSLVCTYQEVEGISQTLTFSELEEPDNIDYWRSWFEDYAKLIVQRYLEDVTTVKLSVACNGIYMQNDTGELSEPMVMNSAHSATLNRHTSNLESKIENQFLAVHDPNRYSMRLQEQFGSKIGHLEIYNSFTMNFLFPYEFNAKALATGYILHKCIISRYLKYLPYNTDGYCVLHSIFAGCTGELAGKSLNGNAEYMKDFNKWFQENNLADFYVDGIFELIV